MVWLLLILVLLAAAFGVLGAVIKLTAAIVLTILLTVAVLAAVAWFGIKAQLRRWQQGEAGGGSQLWTWSGGSGRDLPSHDDRY
jgi:alkylation response protein AidB-like acyl-CoA dehydrogenase